MPSTQSQKETSSYIKMLVFAMVLWGISWPNGKVITQYISVDTFVFIRFIFCSLSLAPIILYLGKSLKVPRIAWRGLAINVILTAFYNAWLFLGIKQGLAGYGGIMVTTLSPIVTFFIGALVARTRLTKRQNAGLFMGLIGGLITMHIWDISVDELLKGGNLYLLCCVVLWSVITVNASYVTKHVGAMTFSFWVYFFNIFIAAFFADFGELANSLDYGVYFWGNVFYNSVIAVSVATTIYIYASSHIGAGRTGSFMFVIPFIAMVSSYFILGETPQIFAIIGGGISILAVMTINKKPKKRDKEQCKNTT